MVNEEKTLKEVCERFLIEGEFRRFEVINSGHINTTYRVYYFRHGEEKDYIVQRVNTYVFQNPIEMMENIENCLNCGKCKSKCPYGLDCPTLLKNNLKYYREFIKEKGLV